MRVYLADQPVFTGLLKTHSAVEAAPSTGSRRSKLWDLPHHSLCTVVGVCLPLDVIRRLLSSVYEDTKAAHDYELHTRAVAESKQRTKLSETLHDELDRRYASTLQSFKLAKSIEALMDLWMSAVNLGDVAGAFWATLTHPRCDAQLLDQVCQDMHMLQHQAGAMIRTDIKKFNALFNENGVLTRELGKLQERSTRLLVEKTTEIERLTVQLNDAQSENLQKEVRITSLGKDLSAMKLAITDLADAMHSQKKITQLNNRLLALEEKNTDLKQALLGAKQQLATHESKPHLESKAALEKTREQTTHPIVFQMKEKSILCVGGRTKSIANYRDLVEREGAKFAHHDGGIEENANLLTASLAAADLVICQTGCISHNAYWRVKDFCKRTGKQCVFIENPSVSSFDRMIKLMSQAAPEPNQYALSQAD